MSTLRMIARDGVVDVGTARRHGIDAGELRRRTAAGECERLFRGWYAVPPSTDPRSRHVLLTQAFVRAFAGRVCPSHHSLLALHGLPLWRADLEVVHLCRMADDHSRHRAGAIIHPNAGRTVTLATAIVQTGLVNGPVDSLIAADAAVHRALTTPVALGAALGRFKRHPNIAAVRHIMADIDGRTESPGETRLRHLMGQLGIGVTPQVSIADGPLTWRVDFLVDGTKVVLEFDGLVKYDTGTALVEEKRREDRLRALGYEVVRIVWADLDRPEYVLQEVFRAIARARRAA